MVVMGRISAPYGIKGWVKVHPFTETIDSLLDFPVWYLGEGGHWHESRVVEVAVHGDSVVAKLETCPDRDAAEALKGFQVAVPRGSLPDAPEDEYYWLDLVGLRVIGQDEVELGTVQGMIETGANDVLDVKGDARHLIPFISDYIVEVDLKNGLIRADWGADY